MQHKLFRCTPLNFLNRLDPTPNSHFLKGDAFSKASTHEHGFNPNASADLLYPYVTLKPVLDKIQGEEVLSVRTPAALQVYGEDLFRLTELVYQDREHPGMQLRCNQGDSLYIYHPERVAVMTMHLEVCQDADEKEVTGECKIFSSSSHNDASSSDVQVGTVASYVEEPAFRFFPKHHFYQYGIHSLNFKNW